MMQALEALDGFKKRAQAVSVDGNRHYNPGWHTAVDLHNMLVCSEAVTRCAIERKESRGAQARADYPDKDDAHSKFNLIAVKGPDGKMQVRKQPVVPIREDLVKIIEENQK
jgi:succinate dehydrogenase / fumarate reductase flavoprotein subunit